jgi:hypothetical protein
MALARRRCRIRTLEDSSRPSSLTRSAASAICRIVIRDLRILGLTNVVSDMSVCSETQWTPASMVPPRDALRAGRPASRLAHANERWAAREKLPRSMGSRGRPRANVVVERLARSRAPMLRLSGSPARSPGSPDRRARRGGYPQSGSVRLELLGSIEAITAATAKLIAGTR